jgi:hypothetical protein
MCLRWYSSASRTRLAAMSYSQSTGADTQHPVEAMKRGYRALAGPHERQMHLVGSDVLRLKLVGVCSEIRPELLTALI